MGEPLFAKAETSTLPWANVPRSRVAVIAAALAWAFVGATSAGADEAPAPPADAPASATPVPGANVARGGLAVPPARPKAATSGGRKPAAPYGSEKLTAKAKEYYPAAWGIDALRVAATNAGNLIRFSFRVVEPKLAKPLADHEATPYLYSPRAHAFLQVPTMEKVGQLRQFGLNEANKDYWMVFSNKGNLVHKGDRVNVIIGKFHADGLLVE